MKYFDTHAHYNDKAFDENREEILNKCKAENVEYIVNVGASVKESLECIKLANTHDFIYSSIGIHPYNAKGDKVQDLYDMYKNEITLPLHTLLDDEDVTYVIESFKNAIGEVVG